MSRRRSGCSGRRSGPTRTSRRSGQATPGGSCAERHPRPRGGVRPRRSRPRGPLDVRAAPRYVRALPRGSDPVARGRGRARVRRNGTGASTGAPGANPERGARGTSGHRDPAPPALGVSDDRGRRRRRRGGGNRPRPLGELAPRPGRRATGRRDGGRRATRRDGSRTPRSSRVSRRRPPTRRTRRG